MMPQLYGVFGLNFVQYLGFFSQKVDKLWPPYAYVRPSRGNGTSLHDGVDTSLHQLFETNNFGFQVRREFFRVRPLVRMIPRIPARTREKTV